MSIHFQITVSHFLCFNPPVINDCPECTLKRIHNYTVLQDWQYWGIEGLHNAPKPALMDVSYLSYLVVLSVSEIVIFTYWEHHLIRSFD